MVVICVVADRNVVLYPGNQENNTYSKYDLLSKEMEVDTIFNSLKSRVLFRKWMTFLTGITNQLRINILSYSYLNISSRAINTMVYLQMMWIKTFWEKKNKNLYLKNKFMRFITYKNNSEQRLSLNYQIGLIVENITFENTNYKFKKTIVLNFRSKKLMKNSSVYGISYMWLAVLPKPVKSWSMLITYYVKNNKNPPLRVNGNYSFMFFVLVSFYDIVQILKITAFGT
ncbi:hypothetical protein AGLY_001770 [Aphis glycines]|uniref:Uncharacterized protein n=1 Tax=Aphis glycines TaxID=307491 RepID=A0A6G0U4N1_APHGL|nr:hypothetical protein AGLY_001770 [Aphis glycines]